MKKDIVSIAVISFNSQKTIIDTLNSILLQDYGSNNIELIISDDASIDNTKNLITSWSEKNKPNFNNLKINFNEKNQGLVKNFNLACKLSTSIWIKPIAADDLLYSNCISEFYNYIHLNKKIECVFCYVERFNENGILGISPRDNYFFNLSNKKQFISLLVDNYIAAPGSFLKKSILEKYDFADENYINMEDYPLWLKFSSNKINLSLIEKKLVKYRINDSLSNSNERLINPNINFDIYRCKIKNLKKLNANIIIKLLLLFDIYLFRLSDLIKLNIFKNKKNKLSLFISPLVRLLSPLFILRKLKSLINKH